jgi:Bacterial pre-peptidase C-terminal domain/PEP-CTERM motif
MRLKVLAAVAATILVSTPAAATDFSFTGTFTQDDNVQLFNFVVGAPSNVTLRTWSYAGGTNAAGSTIARGGFDPILALFDSAGNRINQNDDGGCGLVAADSGTGRCWDTFLTSALTAGTYTVAVMEYDNFAGTTLASAFERQGQGNFTPGISGCAASQNAFEDVSQTAGCGRDNHWAFDILNVAQAEVVGGAVPEPSSWAMMLLGFAGVGLTLRRGARRRGASTQIA